MQILLFRQYTSCPHENEDIKNGGKSTALLFILMCLAFESHAEEYLHLGLNTGGNTRYYSIQIEKQRIRNRIGHYFIAGYSILPMQKYLSSEKQCFYQWFTGEFGFLYGRNKRIITGVSLAENRQVFYKGIIYYSADKQVAYDDRSRIVMDYTYIPIKVGYIFPIRKRIQLTLYALPYVFHLTREDVYKLTTFPVGFTMNFNLKAK